MHAKSHVATTPRAARELLCAPMRRIKHTLDGEACTRVYGAMIKPTAIRCTRTQSYVEMVPLRHPMVKPYPPRASTAHLLINYVLPDCPEAEQ